MSEVFALIVVFYALFSILFSLMWIDSILNDYNFINWYLDRIENKNAFGKTYVTVFALFMLPSYLITVFCFYVLTFMQWVYELGIKKDEEVTK